MAEVRKIKKIFFHPLCWKDTGFPGNGVLPCLLCSSLFVASDKGKSLC